MKKYKDVILYIIMGIIGCMIIVVLGWNVYLSLKTDKLTDDEVILKNTNEKAESEELTESEDLLINGDSCIYEGNNLKFTYDKSLIITYREQKNCKNITVNNSDGSMVISSVLIQLDDMDIEGFFECFEDFAEYRKEWKEVVSVTRTANDGAGTEYYREYEILDIDFNEFKALAQVQELENGYYILTLAYIEEDFADNEELAKTIMDSTVYSEVEDKGELELTQAFSPLFQIDSFLIEYVDMDTELDIDDLIEKSEEHEKSIQADTSLVAVDGYEYLMQRDIASADGNIYKIMVPKDYGDAYFSDDKRFITYGGNGFDLSMYARLLFQGETLEDFLEVSGRFECEMPEYKCINIKKSEVFEKEGMLYQICTADKEQYDGTYIPKMELVAAIPLGGDDTLAFQFELTSYEYSSETIKYLEEIEGYYGVPVTQLIEMVEGVEAFQ